MTASAQNVGICKLCQLSGELRDSHLIPAAAYRLILKTTNERPIVVGNDVAIHTDSQFKDYLLCGNCERLFDQNGERWVMANCFRPSLGEFRLFEILQGATPCNPGEENKLFEGARIQGVEPNKLAYFAASIMWRRCAHDWRLRGNPLEKLSLGPYEDLLRMYLLGQSAFPDDVVIWVAVNPNKEHWNAFSIPYGGWDGHHGHYRFQLQGINFDIFAGRELDKVTRDLCIARPPHYLSIADKDCLERDFGKTVRQSKLVNPIAPKP